MSNWKYIYSPSYQTELVPDNVGKWMIFTPVNNSFYLLRDKLFKACKNSKLGIAVKYRISTKKDSVFIVYTKDYKDKADISRVLAKLREIGVKGKLYYKTDKMTKAGIRGSLFNSDLFEN